MIHHFADLLDRKDDYWAMVPNRERFAFALNGPVADKQSLQIATIGTDTPFWEQIFECGDLQELVLEYVSGFCDLSPLRELKSLRSAHFENLRRASDFSGLSGMASLRYLCINGTLDWDQPIVDFEFLKGLCSL